VVRKQNGSYIVDTLQLDKDERGEINVENFGTKITALIVIPSVQDPLPSDNKYFSFFWSASIERNHEEPEIIKELMAKIDELKVEIAMVQAKINEILASKGQEPLCGEIKNNLYYGLKDNQEVRYLQVFLKNQGQEIYPEGLVTGNFLSLTRAAVVRFQERFAQDILNPLGLVKGTGFVGEKTRAGINNLLCQ